MPTTAKAHFDQDMTRAEGLLQRAEAIRIAEPDAAADLARSATVFAVGALDAYLCDAYVDTFTRTLQSCRVQRVALPAKYGKTLLPAGPLFAAHYTARHNWALRMAARKLMEKDNLLQISRVKDLLNPALPAGQKLWSDIIQTYVALDRRRLTKHVTADLAALAGRALSDAKEEAVGALLARIGRIVQRRHDIAHNCDRPRYAYTAMTPPQASKMLRDVKSFAEILDAHLDAHRVY